MEKKIFLKLENVSKNYGGVVALKGVSLEILKGEIHSLVGENGSGKSTLVKIITGVVDPEPGAIIEIDGKVFRKLKPIQSLKLGIHVVHQDLSLFPNLTVAENIAIHLHNERAFVVDWKSIRDLARTTTESLGIRIPLHSKVGDLSLADQQIVAICRAIAGEAKLLIFDEPTASLTSAEVDRLFDFLRRLKERGISVLFISHRLEEVLEISDRITVLRDGVKIGTFDKSDLNKERLSFLMTGRKLDYGKRKSREAERRKVILEVRNLTKIGQFENVSFKLHSGEILGFIGPRGAGRTELALSIFGMNKPDSGEIFVNGRRVSISSNRKAVLLGIGYVPENRLVQGLVLDQPIHFNTTITILKKLVKKLLLDFKRMRRLTEEYIEKLKIKTSSIFSPVKNLSGGNQQKVVLAKWMLTKPRIFILDSPTIGIDVGAKESIYSLVRKLSDEGLGIIFISDETTEVLNVCDRVLLMKNGKIIREVDPKQMNEEELTRLIKE